METNLLTHQIATLIQELALPRFQGDVGFERILTLINGGLEKVTSNVEKATLSDYRKLYHEEWKLLLKTFCQESYQETLNDRFKKLVF